MKVAWVLTILVISLSAFAEHGDNSASGPVQRPKGKPTDADAHSVFGNKCQSCHDGDGKFTDKDLPSEEWRDKILKALNREPGVRPMPPASKPQLTDDEKSLINRWAGIEQAVPQDDVCAGKIQAPSAEVIKGIFADRCVTCHGKLSFNPTSLLRPVHEQFLSNDGTFDLSILGDMSEIEQSQLPAGKTSIPRMVDALTGYTMPPRGNLPVISTPSDRLLPKVGTPHMTTAERQYLVNVLNQQMRRENCPLKTFTPVAFLKSGKPALSTFASASKACEALGMRIPTRKQVTDNREKVEDSVKSEGCVWTSTFDADPKQERAVRKILDFDKSGKSSISWATEGYKCQTLCVK